MERSVELTRQLDGFIVIPLYAINNESFEFQSNQANGRMIVNGINK